MPNLARTRSSLYWFLSFTIGIASLRFLLLGLDEAFPTMDHHLDLGQFWFVLHVSAGPAALMLTPFQMSERFRTRHTERHRILGRIYAGLILVAGTSGLVIALNADGGLVGRFGFGSLAVTWLLVTARAIVHARARRFTLHRAWMIRSAALTFAGVTLRLWLLGGIAAGLPFDTLVYPYSAWLCWLPNLAIAEFLIRRPAPQDGRQRQLPQASGFAH